MHYTTYWISYSIELQLTAQTVPTSNVHWTRTSWTDAATGGNMLEACRFHRDRVTEHENHNAHPRDDPGVDYRRSHGGAEHPITGTYQWHLVTTNRWHHPRLHSQGLRGAERTIRANVLYSHHCMNVTNHRYRGPMATLRSQLRAVKEHAAFVKGRACCMHVTVAQHGRQEHLCEPLHPTFPAH